MALQRSEDLATARGLEAVNTREHPRQDSTPPTREKAPLAPLPRLAVSVSEAGATIGVGRDAIYALMRSGELPYLKIGKHTAIRLEDLSALVERRAAQTQATVAAERTLLTAAREEQQQRRYRR